MIKLIFLFWSVFCFSQVEKQTNNNLTKPNTNDSINNNIGVVGYQFYKGGFISTSLTNNWQLNTGFLYTNTIDNTLEVEIPILFKYNINNKFHAFFGSKLSMVKNNGLSTMQPLGITRNGFGVSAEFGLQYDVSDKLMLELRYSLPVIEQSANQPSSLNYGNGGLLKLGSSFKF